MRFDRLVLLVVWAALMFMCLCLLAGCKMTEKIVTVTEYRDRVQHDTIVQADSVYVSRYIKEKGDTVLMTDTFIYYKYLDKYAYTYVHDSVPYEVRVEVPKRMRNGYDRFTSWGFWILALLLLLRVGWWVVKKVYLKR